MINLIIADDHRMFREGLISLLKEEKDIHIMGEASTGKEILELLDDQLPDILLLDIEMPDMDGFEVLRTLKKREFGIKVLALTMHKSAEFIKNIIKGGADGYLQKDSGKEALIQAIVQLHENGSYYTPEVASLMLDDLRGLNQNSKISPREKEVVQLIVEGNTTKEIAEKLFLSKHTIESHRQNILSKLHLKNSAELVRYAIQKGWA